MCREHVNLLSSASRKVLFIAANDSRCAPLLQCWPFSYTPLGWKTSNLKNGAKICTSPEIQLDYRIDFANLTKFANFYLIWLIWLLLFVMVFAKLMHAQTLMFLYDKKLTKGMSVPVQTYALIEYFEQNKTGSVV